VPAPLRGFCFALRDLACRHVALRLPKPNCPAICFIITGLGG
jgi:hypothetical protein